MSIDLSEEDVSRLVVAIDHYEAYLRSLGHLLVDNLERSCPTISPTSKAMV